MRYSQLVLLLAGCYAISAHAYIGPGLGAGTVGVVLGMISSVLLALLAILYYPIKRMLKKRKKKVAEVTENNEQAE